MGFFEQFFTWLNGQLAVYVSANAARVASAIEPVAVTLATIYVMVWGYLSLTGRVQEPIWEGVKRIVVIGILLGIALRLWTYKGLSEFLCSRRMLICSRLISLMSSGPCRAAGGTSVEPMYSWFNLLPCWRHEPAA